MFHRVPAILRRNAMLIALALGALPLAIPAPANAYWWHGDGRHGEGWHGEGWHGEAWRGEGWRQGWRGDGWRGGYGWRGPRVVGVVPPPLYEPAYVAPLYVPPPVYVAPRVAYVPPVAYSAPEIVVSPARPHPVHRPVVVHHCACSCCR